jgi:hypothetical protein
MEARCTNPAAAGFQRPPFARSARENGAVDDTEGMESRQRPDFNTQYRVRNRGSTIARSCIASTAARWEATIRTTTPFGAAMLPSSEAVGGMGSKRSPIIDIDDFE